MKNLFLLPVLFLSINLTAQTAVNGILNHTNSYFTIHPYNSSYDDGSYVKTFYDGNNKLIHLWNSDANTDFTNLKLGSLYTMGQLGIGTTSPSHALEVIGDALFTDSGGEALVLHPDGNNRRGIVSSNFQLAFIADKVNTYSPDKRIIFGAGGETPDDPNFETYMMINRGKVAIGTTDFSNDHKLRVEGSIGAREVKVEANGWSDFVFEENYKRPTLEELETYIQQNKHLPEIPTETEVTENGINLGEMNAKLLQKIEELTLYLIEEHKENQLLKQRIEKLENNVVKSDN